VSLVCSVGVEADSAKISKLLAELDGKDLNEVIAAGREKLASVPSGGAVAAAAAPAAAGAAAAGGAAAAAPKEEAKKEEEPESDEVNICS
jgi:large subunit ribosomal protein LP2